MKKLIMFRKVCALVLVFVLFAGTAVFATNGAQKPISITVKKEWRGGPKPDTVIELWRKGKVELATSSGSTSLVEKEDKIGSFIANADMTSHTFDNLLEFDAAGERFEYTVKEPDVPEGYEASYDVAKYTVVNTYKEEMVTVVVNKVWIGGEKGHATLELRRRGEGINGEKIDELVKKLNVENENAEFEFELPKKAPSGKSWDYYVVETNCPKSYTPVYSRDGMTVYNMHFAVDVTIHKTWKGGDKPKTVIELWRNAVRPEGYTTRSELIGEFTVDKDTVEKTFANLDRLDSHGAVYNYFAVEREMAGYKAEVKPAVLNSKDNWEIEVINTYEGTTVPGTTPPIAPQLNKKDHFAYIVGYPDGTFGPARTITRAEMCAIFSRLMIDEVYVDASYYGKFSDVKAGAWYTDYVLKLTKAGVISGYADGSFRPNQPVTRGEFATVASRFIENQKNIGGFKDLDAAHWAKNNIEAVFAEGWISGYPDGSFRPSVPISRAEVVSVVNEMLNRHADEAFVDANVNYLNHFKDIKKDFWAYYKIMEAANSHNYKLEANGAEKWISIK